MHESMKCEKMMMALGIQSDGSYICDIIQTWMTSASRRGHKNLPPTNAWLILFHTIRFIGKVKGPAVARKGSGLGLWDFLQQVS